MHKDWKTSPGHAERTMHNPEKEGKAEVDQKGLGFIAYYIETDNTREGGGVTHSYPIELDKFHDAIGEPTTLEEAVNAADNWLLENGIS